MFWLDGASMATKFYTNIFVLSLAFYCLHRLRWVYK